MDSTVTNESVAASDVGVLCPLSARLLSLANRERRIDPSEGFEQRTALRFTSRRTRVCHEGDLHDVCSDTRLIEIAANAVSVMKFFV